MIFYKHSICLISRILVIILVMSIIYTNSLTSYYSENQVEDIVINLEKNDSVILDNLSIDLNRNYLDIMQSNWSGGPDQINYIDKSKYFLENNIDTDTDGNIILKSNGMQEFWYDKSIWNNEVLGAVWDPLDKQILVLTFDELWAYFPNNDTWLQKSTIPYKRYSFGLTWDSISNKMILVGGKDEKDQWFNDIWEYDPLMDKWTFINNTPFYRNSHSVVFDPNNNQIIIYGGFAPSVFTNETWIYNFNTAQFIQKKGYYNVSKHKAVWDSINNVMLIYGGYNLDSNGIVYYNNLSSYDPNTDSWSDKKSNKRLCDHSFIWSNKLKAAISYGGIDYSKNDWDNELWLYNVTSDNWFQLKSATKPSGSHVAVWDDDNDQMVVFGGFYYIGNKKNNNENIRIYKMESPSYFLNGYLESSTFDLKRISKLETVNIFFDSIPSLNGNYQIQLQIGIPSGDNWNYIGFDMTNNSRYNIFNENAVDLNIDFVRYFRYKIYLKTGNSGITPVINRIAFNYSFYENMSEIQLNIVDSGLENGRAIVGISYSSVEPENTSLSLFLRSSNNFEISDWSEWENIINEQHFFITPTNRYYNFKVVLRTDDNSITPVLKSLIIYFNKDPVKPESIQPLNNSVLNTSKPDFKWIFNDLDDLDLQTGYRLQIGNDKDFNNIFYDTDNINSNLSYHIMKTTLPDGIYYWHVKTCDNHGRWGDWSDTFKLIIDLTPPEAPVIFSYSHMNENQWYKNDDIHINWYNVNDFSGIAGFSYELNRDPEYEPDDKIDMNITEYNNSVNNINFDSTLEYINIKSEIWYFHIKAVDNSNLWSNISHFKIQIDNELPTFQLDTMQNAGANNTLCFNISCYDNHSGIETVKLFWRYESENQYKEQTLVCKNNSYNINFNYTLRIQQNQEYENIEYYFIIQDRAGNIVFSNNESNNFIAIHDNIPPQFEYVSKHNFQSNRLPILILIYAIDNIKVDRAQIEFVNHDVQFEMMKITDNLFIIEINDEMFNNLELRNPQSKKEFIIRIYDTSGNTNVNPINGTFVFNISIPEDIQSNDNVGKKNIENNENMLLMKIFLVLIIFISVVIILMLGYIKRNRTALRFFELINSLKMIEYFKSKSKRGIEKN